MPALATRKLGPGSLKLGETGSPREMASEVTKCTIEPSWKDEDPTPVLDGSEFYDEGRFEGTLSGEFMQEYSMKSLVAWTWENTGKELPFVFRPRNDNDMTITGKVIVRAVSVGGDVKTANTASFEWKISGGMPEMKAASGGSSSGSRNV